MTEEAPRKKASYIGVPAIFELKLACNHLTRAFGEDIYIVGSSTQRPDWRDVDLVMIMEDDAFEREFPDIFPKNCQWEFDPKWLILTCAISKWLTEKAGVPVDFKFQPRTWANENHKGNRDSIGHFMIPRTKQ